MSEMQAGRLSQPDDLSHQATNGAPIYTVSELTREIRNLLEHHLGRVWVAGEITNLRRPASGHCYFTLKDEYAQISVVMWRATVNALKFDAKDGLAVVVQGELTVYEPRGQYQVVARRMEPRGVGALQLAFMQLKDKLAREGLFEPERRQPLPFIPRQIAIITSPTGAAVQDMLSVITSRFPAAHVLICPVRVQGAEAAGEIAAMIERVNLMPQVEVIIVGRGGGSIEDLWAFNEEVVARAIAGSRIPIVSAVGHETDFTIADFVADVRALTPTDAGARVVPEAQQLAANLKSVAGRLGQALLKRVIAVRERLDGITRAHPFRRPLEQVRVREQRLDELTQRLVRGATNTLRMQRQRFDTATARLDSLSPLAVLSRGYSITLRDIDGAIVRNAATLQPGEVVRTRLRQGEFRAIVIEQDAAPTVQPPRPKPKAKKKSSRTRKKTTKAPAAKKKISKPSKRRTSDGAQENEV